MSEPSLGSLCTRLSDTIQPLRVDRTLYIRVYTCAWSAVMTLEGVLWALWTIVLILLSSFGIKRGNFAVEIENKNRCTSVRVTNNNRPLGELIKADVV